MARSQESNNKKDVRNKKAKKRKDKEQKKQAKKDNERNNSLDDMIAYVDKNGNITDTPPDPNQEEEVNLEDIEVSVPKDDTKDKQDPVRRGVITYFNDAKGFGFIRDTETKEDVFVHVNNMLEDLRQGNTVTFEVEMGNKGPVAVQVKMHRPE